MAHIRALTVSVEDDAEVFDEDFEDEVAFSVSPGLRLCNLNAKKPNP